MASNSSSCSTPGSGHLNGYPVPHYAFFFPHMIGGLSPPGTLPGMQHQLPVSGYSTPSPASEYSAFSRRRLVHVYALWEMMGSKNKLKTYFLRALCVRVCFSFESILLPSVIFFPSWLYSVLCTLKNQFCNFSSMSGLNQREAAWVGSLLARGHHVTHVLLFLPSPTSPAMPNAFATCVFGICEAARRKWGM